MVLSQHLLLRRRRAYRNEEEGADPVGPLASTEGGPIGARLVEGSAPRSTPRRPIGAPELEA